MDESLEQLDALRQMERRAVMATLVATRGTTPKKEGAKMWVGQGGRILGSVTIGGCVDARVVEEADALLERGERKVVSLSLSDEEAWDIGMTCGGAVDVLLEPVELASDDDPLVRAYDAIRQTLETGGTAVAATPLSGSGGWLVVREDGSRVGGLGRADLEERVVDEARRVMAEGRGTVLDLETRAEADAGQEEPARLFLELHRPPVTLYLFGANHVAMSLVRFARELGWRVEVVDNRERYANRERFPGAHRIHRSMVDEAVRSLPMDESSVVVVVAHDYKYEIPVLKTALARSPSYVGVLGSRRRGQALLDFLAEDGVSRKELERIHIPVGLDLGARTAAEIALATVAEVLAMRRGRPGTPLRDRG